MTGHLCCSVRIADLVLQRLTRPPDNLQEHPVIPLQKYEKRYTPFQLRRPLLVAVGQGGSKCGIKLRNVLFKRPLDVDEFFSSFHLMCSTCNTRRVTTGFTMALS